MSKLSYEDKVEIYNKRKKGVSLETVHQEYKIDARRVKYLVRLIERHGYKIVQKKKNKRYSLTFKIDAINRVLNKGESTWAVSIDLGLPSHGMLSNWISKYKENGYNIVERKRGRPTMPKVTKKKSKETKDETIKRLQEENLYLKAELEYSKKLRAVVQARKNQQQKKK